MNEHTPLAQHEQHRKYSKSRHIYTKSRACRKADITKHAVRADIGEDMLQEVMFRTSAKVNPKSVAEAGEQRKPIIFHFLLFSTNNGHFIILHYNIYGLHLFIALLVWAIALLNGWKQRQMTKDWLTDSQMIMSYAASEN